jgi:hypothetical protein
MPLVREADFLGLPASQGPYRVRAFFPEGDSRFKIGRLLLKKLFCLRSQMVTQILSIVEIIDKLKLCVKHYYHTTFSVPKMLTHSGIVLI